MFFRGGVNYIRKIENFYLLKTFFEETKNVNVLSNLELIDV